MGSGKQLQKYEILPAIREEKTRGQTRVSIGRWQGKLKQAAKSSFSGKHISLLFLTLQHETSGREAI